MVCCYTAINDWQDEPVATALKAYWPSTPGVLDRIAIRASGVADRYTGRLLGAPPTTTVGGSSTIPASALSIPVANVMGIGPLDVMVFATGETVQVRDATFTKPALPNPIGSTQYPGTVTLNPNSPTRVSHSVGEAIQVYRQDRWRMIGKSTHPVDEGLQLSQQAQIAEMHAPALMMGQSGRQIFVKQYPLHSLYAVYQALPWTNTEVAIDFASTYIEQEDRCFRLPVGFYNPPQSILRTQYLAGYNPVPDDVISAVHLLMAEEVAQMLNPSGAWQVGSGGEMVRMSPTTRGLTGADQHPVSFRTEKAYELLEGHKRRWS